MSFQAGPSIESQQGGHADFDVLCTSITDGLYELGNSINILRRLLSRLNTNKATKASEERLASVTEESTKRFKRLGEDVKEMADWDAKQLSATQKFTQQKLSKEFGGLLTEFRNLQRTAAEKQRQRNEATKLAIDAEQHSEQTPLLNDNSNSNNRQLQTQQLSVVNQDEVDFQNSMVLERESEIQNIEQGVNEINMIFKDLGTLVSQQGAQLDTVEDNISNLAQNSENASKQLKKADEHQRKRRNWSCCVLLVLAVVLTIILLAVLT